MYVCVPLIINVLCIWTRKLLLLRWKYSLQVRAGLFMYWEKEDWVKKIYQKQPSLESEWHVGLLSRPFSGRVLTPDVLSGVNHSRASNEEPTDREGE